MMTDSVTLVASSTSSITAGTGTMITSTLAISDSGSTRSCQRENRDILGNRWLRFAGKPQGKSQLGATKGVDKRGRTIPRADGAVQCGFGSPSRGSAEGSGVFGGNDFYCLARQPPPKTPDPFPADCRLAI